MAPGGTQEMDRDGKGEGGGDDSQTFEHHWNWMEYCLAGFPCCFLDMLLCCRCCRYERVTITKDAVELRRKISPCRFDTFEYNLNELESVSRNKDCWQEKITARVDRRTVVIMSDYWWLSPAEKRPQYKELNALLKAKMQERRLKTQLSHQTWMNEWLPWAGSTICNVCCFVK